MCRSRLWAWHSPSDYFGAATWGRGTRAARKCRGLPRHPLQLCKECPCARVAARQALPRHIPDFRAPGSTGDSQPHASDGVGAVLPAQQLPAGRSITLQNITTLRQDEANERMGKQGPGGL